MGRLFADQVAIESRCDSTDLSSQRQMVHLRCCASRTAGTLLGQGATEYLVLLAVVLVIALVGIALLGFFPGTTSDAQLTESKIYWQSAGPIAIAEWVARPHPASLGYTGLYMRLRNTGSYPVRISKILGYGSSYASRYRNVDVGWSDYHNLSEVSIGPGEEVCFGTHWTSCQSHEFQVIGTDSQGDMFIRASRLCAINLTETLEIPSFGFEYVQYVEGQQITKRQVGTKPLIIKCS